MFFNPRTTKTTTGAEALISGTAFAALEGPLFHVTVYGGSHRGPAILDVTVGRAPVFV
jgi:hypothetical protein